jgi:hypothetical protein
MQVPILVIVVGIVGGVGAACGDADSGHVSHDAAADAFTCGVGNTLHGELMALDSSDAQPLPVVGARITANAAPGGSVLTGDDGKFSLCVGSSDPILMELDAPAGYLEGTLYLETVHYDTYLRLRTFTEARASTFYTERSLTYQANKAQVLVLALFDRSGLTLDRATMPPRQVTTASPGQQTRRDATCCFQTSTRLTQPRCSPSPPPSQTRSKITRFRSRPAS